MLLSACILTCMHECVRVCMLLPQSPNRLCSYMWTCIFTYVYAHVYEREAHMHEHVLLYIYIYIYTHVCVSIHTYTHIYIYRYVSEYIWFLA